MYVLSRAIPLYDVSWYHQRFVTRYTAHAVSAPLHQCNLGVDPGCSLPTAAHRESKFGLSPVCSSLRAYRIAPKITHPSADFRGWAYREWRACKRRSKPRRKDLDESFQENNIATRATIEVIHFFSETPSFRSLRHVLLNPEH